MSRKDHRIRVPVSSRCSLDVFFLSSKFPSSTSWNKSSMLSQDYYPTTTPGQWVSAFAMLTGVLVIAFPVSIFSDLWSQELKEVKGPDSLLDDENCYEDGRSGGSYQKQNMENSVNIPRPQGSLGLQNEYQKLLPEEEDFRPNLSTHIVLERDDLNEIVTSIRDINEKQQRIQRILQKYQIQEEG